MREDIIRLASKYGRYGYKRITALLRVEGWYVNHKRVARIWREEGLKVPVKQKKRGRLYLNDGSCIRLDKVITNLLSNAAKFSKENTDVNVYIKKEDNNIIISVEDTGMGIPEEFHSKIFQSFSQADSSDSRKKGGTGLGLVICKEIIEKMGGQISFESKEGVGTTFNVVELILIS